MKIITITISLHLDSDAGDDQLQEAALLLCENVNKMFDEDEDPQMHMSIGDVFRID